MTPRDVTKAHWYPSVGFATANMRKRRSEWLAANRGLSDELELVPLPLLVFRMEQLVMMSQRGHCLCHSCQSADRTSSLRRSTRGRRSKRAEGTRLDLQSRPVTQRPLTSRLVFSGCSMHVFQCTTAIDRLPLVDSLLPPLLVRFMRQL